MNRQQLRETLTKKYCSKGTFQHVPAEQIRILPYVTHSPKPVAIEEFRSWLGLAGETTRRLTQTKLTQEVTLEAVMQEVGEQVHTDSLPVLQQVIKRTVFDATGNLLPFYNSVFKYLPIAGNKALKGLAAMVSDVFLSDSDVTRHADLAAPPGNVLYQLVHKSLPELTKDSRRNTREYFAADVGLSSVFKQDWTFIWQRKDGIRTNLPELLKFYSFQYQMRVAEKLDGIFDKGHCNPLFFTLDWEKCSVGRKAYVGGWKRIEPKIRRLYSHVNCLELLNTLDAPGLPPAYDYNALRDWVFDAPQSDVQHYSELLQEATDFYWKNIADLGFIWQNHADKLEPSEWGHPILNRVHYLWLLIDCQFRNSERNAPAQRYAKWATRQALENYGKRRGRIGHTLALSREQFMFLVWLTVGDEHKVRLHDFWGRLAERGVAFDNQSKTLVVELLEKLNLLEKKSDSGDAQYVRAIV